MSKTCLNIVYKNGVISIPFKGIKNIDMFTIGFNSYKELYERLSKLLNINIDFSNIMDIYINYEYKERNKRGHTVIKKLPIRLSMDDYDIQDVKRVYAQYYKDNHNRINTTDDGIKNVNHEAIKRFCYNSMDISDNDIDLAVNSYFKGDSYKKYRDAYFLLIQTGYDIKQNVYDRENRTDLSKYSTSDEYFNYLRKYSFEGSLEHDKAIELLSLYDMEELRDMKGLFDGNTPLEKEDDWNLYIMALEELTGMDLDDLRESIKNLGDSQNKDNGRKK